MGLNTTIHAKRTSDNTWQPVQADTAGAMKVNVVRTAVGAGQAVAIGGSSTQSSAFDTAARAVRVYVSADAWVEIGANPTAVVNTSFFMPAGRVEYFQCAGSDKVAVLQGTGAGTAYVRAVL
jgi:hypothetical protein